MNHFLYTFVDKFEINDEKKEKNLFEIVITSNCHQLCISNAMQLKL